MAQTKWRIPIIPALILVTLEGRYARAVTPFRAEEALHLCEQLTANGQDRKLEFNGAVENPRLVPSAFGPVLRALDGAAEEACPLYRTMASYVCVHGPEVFDDAATVATETSVTMRRKLKEWQREFARHRSSAGSGMDIDAFRNAMLSHSPATRQLRNALQSLAVRISLCDNVCGPPQIPSESLSAPRSGRSRINRRTEREDLDEDTALLPEQSQGDEAMEMQLGNSIPSADSASVENNDSENDRADGGAGVDEATGDGSGNSSDQNLHSDPDSDSSSQSNAQLEEEPTEEVTEEEDDDQPPPLPLSESPATKRTQRSLQGEASSMESTGGQSQSTADNATGDEEDGLPPPIPSHGWGRARQMEEMRRAQRQAAMRSLGIDFFT